MLAAVLGSLTALAPATLRAEPAHAALVLGNGTYTGLPPLPACLLSAHAVAAALRTAGFNVVEREDVSGGGTDAAIAEFSRQLTAPGTSAFVYSCGYATAFDDRPFLLPVSARLSRSADALTQGILAKSLIDVLARGSAGPSIVAIDTIPIPDAPPDLHFGATTQGTVPDGMGLIVASQAKPPDAPTPLAAALVANLKGATVRTDALMAAAQQQLGANKSITLAAFRPPSAPGDLVAPSSVAVPPTPAPTSPAPPATAASPAPAPAPAAAVAADEQMNDDDRRRVQTALARLGYYDGKIDGVFGPESRAAIRRYQHELGVPMTGRLTAEEATKLVGG